MSASYQPLTIVFFTLIAAAFISCGGSENHTKTTDNAAPVLLFNGTGTSANDVAATETILNGSHIKNLTVNSSEQNAMSKSEIISHRLLIVPGGNFIEIGNSLSKKTAENIRDAVKHGLNYFGICAGAYLAGNSAYYNGFNLTSGVTFGFYSAENKHIRKAALAITGPGAPALDQYWEDGPQLSGWGVVVAKYPDKTPAVTEGKCGNGLVILAGIHPEAPAYSRGGMNDIQYTRQCRQRLCCHAYSPGA